MVLLTLSANLVDALQVYDNLSINQRFVQSADSPTLESREIGQPIAHGQVIDLAKSLKYASDQGYIRKEHKHRLSELLKGSKIYIAPPICKPEPTNEFKELMARLRKEEEARMYHKMTTAGPGSLRQSQPFATPQSLTKDLLSKDEEDEMTFADVNRQMILIINVLVTIIACGIAIWLIASRWHAPVRLALSMGGSGVIGIAEVVIYAGYLRRLKEAKLKERSKVEKKSITKTWTVEGAKQHAPTVIGDRDPTGGATLRNRKRQ